MTNPFMELRKSKEAELKKAKDNEAQKSRQKMVRAAEREKIAVEYENMVLKVLEQLREAFYPSYEIRNSHSPWSIGKDEAYVQNHGYFDGTYYHWVDQVLVSINFDQNDEPIGFECSSGHGHSLCDLAEESLVEALKDLLVGIHPPKQF